MRKVFAALAVLIVLSGCAASTQQPDSTDDLSQQTAVQEQTEPQDDAEEAPVVAYDQIEEPIDEEANLPELQPHYQDIVSESKPAPKEPEPDPTAGKEHGKFVASKERDKYHTPTCRWVEGQMLEENKIWFDSAEDAEAAGFKPCGTCHPKG